jgi:hypothetical protein
MMDRDPLPPGRSTAIEPSVRPQPQPGKQIAPGKQTLPNPVQHPPGPLSSPTGLPPGTVAKRDAEPKPDGPRPTISALFGAPSTQAAHGGTADPSAIRAHRRLAVLGRHLLDSHVPEVDASSSETLAAAVPGSDFRAGVRTPDPAAVMLEAHPAFMATAQGNASVRSAEKVAVKQGPEVEYTYLLTMVDGSVFTIRVMSGPIGSTAVARTIVNPTKFGMTAVTRPGAPTPVHVEVKGRYVIQLNDTVDPANVHRAVAHELAEILAERKLSSLNQPVPPDVLKPGAAPAKDAVLSPHDRGRLAEIGVLAVKANQRDDHAMRELIALVEELGLRMDTQGAAERAGLVLQALNGDSASLTAIARAAAPEHKLDGGQQKQLADVRKRRSIDEDLAKQATPPPVHTLPRAPQVKAPTVSRQQAAELAHIAMLTRMARSDATISHLRKQATQLKDRHPPIGDIQIGGGAGLAAREPMTLLVDARGRWQVDPSEDIAQTANQLKGLKDAGIGDPFQFAAPNQRVPMSAVRYWEDSIAAEGRVIDGEVTGMAIDGHGATTATIKPQRDGVPLVVEVKGAIVASTGFPVERIPGTPRGMTPAKAVDQITAELKIVAADPLTSETNRKLAATALGELASLTGVETRHGQREADLAKIRAILDKYPALEAALTQRPLAKDALAMVDAGAGWDRLRTVAPELFLLGDRANLESLNAKATNRWVIGGLGGTGISAAEIVLARNPSAHVSMVGDQPPPGLIENDQFVAILRNHADQPTVERLAQKFGFKGVKGSGRFSLVFDVKSGLPTYDQASGNVAASGTGASGAARPSSPQSHDPTVGGGYISAIGRDNQLPPVVEMLANSVEADGGKVTMEPLYDADRQYIGYRIHVLGKPDLQLRRAKLRHLDITGAASRSPPWELFDGDTGARALAQQQFAKASDLDAPPESGNFDGGFVSSATQASRYAKARHHAKARDHAQALDASQRKAAL